MANVYQQLLDLIKRDQSINPPRQVGSITVVHDDGTVTVQLPGGGLIRVRGSGSVDARVYIKDGQVQGPAPDLPFVTVEE